MFTRASVVLFCAVLVLSEQAHPAIAFPRSRAVNDGRDSPFGRKRVILHDEALSDARNAIGEDFAVSDPSSIAVLDSITSMEETKKNRLASHQRFLIRVVSTFGWAYSFGLFFFPGKAIKLFFRHVDFVGTAVEPVLKLAIRMIAVTHVAYTAAFVAAPSSKAIQVTTAFLTIVGISIFCHTQAKLDTALFFWSCTVVTSMLIGAHLAALLLLPDTAGTEAC